MKLFNTTGVCVPRKHYMVDISEKLDEIESLIDSEFYFVINRPRQYGKTTTLNELYKRLKSKYTVVRLDFELIGEDFASEERFCSSFIEYMGRSINKELKKASTLTELSKVIIELTRNEEIILLIDEVDRNSNNMLFLSFLGMLRSLYLSREQELATTFKSVILVGVYDVKNLKLKIRNLEEIRYNSPWNIAVNFDVDMSFSPEEIRTMLEEYNLENNLELSIKELSEEIYKFTSGYPFLVSRVCQIVDEKIIGKNKVNWTLENIHRAVKLLINEHNTLFDDLIKNLVNNKELYEYIYDMLILDVRKSYNSYSKACDIGRMFGYFKEKDGFIEISNKIFSEVMYNYMVETVDNKVISKYNFKDNFLTESNDLDMRKVLLKFQQFMKENYSHKDSEFLEKHGRLLFLAFIKHIINGVGFDYKEVQISEEKRLDVIIQYNSKKYVVELKIWYGEEYHKKGMLQLKEYLDIEDVNLGYLLIFNFNKGKKYISKEYIVEDKFIFEVMT